MSDNFHKLFWHWDMDCDGFITSVSSAVKLHVAALAEAAATAQEHPRLFTLRLDDTFWEEFCALSDDKAGHVGDVLQTAPITHIHFDSLCLSNQSSNLTAT
jgi:hypothetical protein